MHFKKEKRPPTRAESGQREQNQFDLNNTRSHFNSQDTKRTLALLFEKGDVVELRSFSDKKGTISGYFNDFNALVNAASKLSGNADAVYVTLNAVNPDLLARCKNRVKKYVRTATTDKDITKRRWLLIDIDPDRPSGISATAAEKQLAKTVAQDAYKFLSEQGFSSPIVADSGNGFHLLHRIDLPNDKDAQDLLKRCLEALDFQFSRDNVSVDTGVHNAARLCKLYGTMACKGDSTPERPHRRSKLLKVPENIDTVSREQLEALAKLLPEQPEPERSRRGGSYSEFDLQNFLREHGFMVKRQKPWHGGTVYEIDCPFDPSHDRGEARIIQFGNGALHFGCFHNSCQSYDWHDLREKFEPGYRDKQKQDTGGYENSYSKNQKSQADRLVALVERLSVVLFHDEYGEPYARIEVKDHHEIWKIRSKNFKRWLTKQMWEHEGKVPNSDALNSTLSIIEAKACFDGSEHTLYNRVVRHDGAIWYDLGNWTAVKVLGGEWKSIKDPPILFRSYSHQKPQVKPDSNATVSDIYDIFDFVNIKGKEHRLLFISNLTASLIPDIAHPIDVFHGDQGTAKTTTARVKKELIDPSQLETQSYNNSSAEFIRMASHHWYFILDNLSYLPKWLSDSLCRVVTGEGYSKRELYTDDEDVIYKFRRCVCLNGINLVPTKADLLDRTLIFELDPIPQSERKSEKEFWSGFKKAKPKLLGALFTLLSRAMKEYNSVNLSAKPRMADFAVWGCAVAKALGQTEQDFIDAYGLNIESQNEEALEANPIGKAVMAFMEGKEKWEGAPSELLEELDKVAERIKLNTDAKKYPKGARWLWRRIKEVRTNLMNAGIEAKKDDGDHSKGRKIVLQRISQQGKKNDVRDVRPQKGQQSQDVSTDDTTDDTDDTKKNDVRRNHPKSLDNNDTDDTDDTFSGSLEDDVPEYLRDSP